VELYFERLFNQVNSFPLEVKHQHKGTTSLSHVLGIAGVGDADEDRKETL
jgi:hypothetical protein